jgi:hypothetical protein
MNSGLFRRSSIESARGYTLMNKTALEDLWKDYSKAGQTIRPACAGASDLSRRNPMDNYHITTATNGWELKKEGAARASKTATTKAEIVELASEFLQDKTASLKIHKEDGTIQEERTYPRSADPVRSKG